MVGARPGLYTWKSSRWTYLPVCLFDLNHKALKGKTITGNRENLRLSVEIFRVPRFHWVRNRGIMKRKCMWASLSSRVSLRKRSHGFPHWGAGVGAQSVVKCVVYNLFTGKNENVWNWSWCALFSVLVNKGRDRSGRWEEGRTHLNLSQLKHLLNCQIFLWGSVRSYFLLWLLSICPPECRVSVSHPVFCVHCKCSYFCESSL